MTVFRQRLCLVLALSCLLAPSSLAQEFPDAEFLLHSTGTMQAAKQADDQMYNYLTSIARLLDRFYKNNGHLPCTTEEESEFKGAAEKLLKGNPYKPQSEETASLNISTNSGLSPKMISDAIKSPPQSWRGEPGAIHVITNSSNLYVLYAISADQMPMRRHDEPDLPVRAIWRDCSSD